MEKAMTQEIGTRHVIPDRIRHSPWALPAVFLVVSAAIVWLGNFYYQQLKKGVVSEEIVKLQAIADLKGRELQNWLGERMGNARQIETNPSCRAELLAFLSDRSSAPRRAAVLDWMQALRSGYHYQNVLLVDAAGEIALALEGPFPVIGSEGRAQIEAVRQQKTASISDLHRSSNVSAIHMDLVVPLLAADAVSGFVFLRIDPAGFLFPLIQSWPTPSLTAETLLVKREGDSVLFLNELRHRRGAAMQMRLPIQPQLPAAQAVRGNFGAFAGHDYRGVPVWSVSRPVPGMPWFFVVKVDRNEVEEPVRRTALGVLAAILALILASALLVLFLWQRRDAIFRRQQLETERQKQALGKQFDYLTRYANDIILLCDDQGNILEASDSAQVAYDLDRETLLKMTLGDLVIPAERDRLAARMQQMQEGGGMFFETRQQRKDGSVFPVEVSARAIVIEDKRYFQNIIRDIGERKAAEIRLRNANRLLAVRSQVNQAIIRARDRRRLFQDVCEATVAAGDMRMAWIGLVDKPSRTVRPACQSGQVAGYLNHISISIDDVPTGRGPTGTAIRENRLVVCNDIGSDERMAPWRGDATRRIYRSSAALPLRFQGECIGALMMYAGEKDYFDRAQVGLLEEVVNDLGFALDALDREMKQHLAETALLESELKFRTLFESMPLGVVYQGADGKIISANPAAERIVGLTLDQMLGLTSLDPRWKAVREDGSDFPGPEHPIPVAQRTGQEVNDVIIGIYDPKCEAIRWLKVSAIPQFLPGETVPYQVFAIFDDISELISKKKELQTTSRRLEMALHAGKAGTWDWDVASGRIVWSAQMFELLGLDAKTSTASFAAWRAVLHPEDREEAGLRIERALKAHSFLDSNYRVVLPDGRVRWINAVGAGVYNEQGQPVQMLGICMDISDRQGAAENWRRTP